MAAENYLLMCSILSLFYTTVAGCNACSSGATSCPTLASIDAGGWESYSRYCYDSTYYVTINSIQVGQADGDGDDFSVTVMDEDNYNKFRNGQSYQYYSDLGTGDVGGDDTTCYDYTGPANFHTGTKVYVTIKCHNWVETCNLRVNLDSTCHSSNPCLGVSCNSHGYCSNGVCVCDTGYSGQNCQNYDPCAVVDCSHGYCVGGQCICDEGYSGPTCSDSCFTLTCMNGGWCTNGKCSCPANYAGSNCQNYNPCALVDCSHGSCVDGQCVCEEGYSGPTCSDSCLTVTCLNGGSCRNGKCSCSGNYAGSDCSTYNGDRNINFSDYTRTIIIIIASCVGGAVLLAVIVLVLCVRSRRRSLRRAVISTELTPVPTHPKATLVSAMEQQ